MTNDVKDDTIETEKREENKRMKEKKEELLTRMIRIYGFEHHDVIEFARLLERGDVSIKTLESVVRSHEMFPRF